MPGTKRTRSGSVKPQLRRTRTFNPHRRPRGMVAVPRNRLNFPQSMKTKLRYVERIDSNIDGTTVKLFGFRGNGLYDPFIPVGGHQPRGFDDFMKIYDKFTVVGSTCTSQFMYEGYDGPSAVASTGNLLKTFVVDNSGNAAALSPIACGIHKSVDTMTPGAVATQIEKDRTRWGYITPQGGNICTLKMKGTTKEFSGKQFTVGAEGFTGNDTSDPTEQWQWTVWMGRCSDEYDSTAEVTKVVALVTMEYDVVFTEPKTLTAS